MPPTTPHGHGLLLDKPTMSATPAHNRTKTSLLTVWLVTPSNVNLYQQVMSEVQTAFGNPSLSSSRTQSSTRNHLALSSHTNVIAHIKARKSRALWQVLAPCLFQGPSSRPSEMMTILLESLIDPSRTSSNDDLCRISNFMSHVLKNVVATKQSDEHSLEPQYMTRKLKLLAGRYPGLRRWRNTRTLWIWMFPSLASPFEFSWEERLIHWEHQLILAQSLAGFCSTMGGGFYLTRHFTSAAQLSRQQQWLAWYLGDVEMAWKCQINQAYDWIQCGEFRMANRLIRSVLKQMRQRRQRAPSGHTTVHSMCMSALLFLKRVQETAIVGEKQAEPLSSKIGSDKPPPMVDDYYRIRIVKDQSSQDDLLRIVQ